MSPGSGFGPGGEGFVRFALVENEHRIRQAVRGIRRVLEAGPADGRRRRSRAPIATTSPTIRSAGPGSPRAASAIWPSEAVTTS